MTNSAGVICLTADAFCLTVITPIPKYAAETAQAVLTTEFAAIRSKLATRHQLTPFIGFYAYKETSVVVGAGPFPLHILE